MVEKYRKAGLLSEFFFNIKPLVRLFNKNQYQKHNKKNKNNIFPV